MTFIPEFYHLTAAEQNENLACAWNARPRNCQQRFVTIHSRVPASIDRVQSMANQHRPARMYMPATVMNSGL
jgi:hypothetical protein